MNSESLRILITAGPTHEAIDRVRYVANRSSGQVGLALAAAAVEAGFAVTLALGPIRNEPVADALVGLDVKRFTSAADLEDLLATEFPKHDVLIMAAAVADYRPIPSEEEKIARTGERLILELEPVPDLVAGVAAGKVAGQKIMAFALEKEATLIERATAKMQRKGVDAIIANPLKTMGADEIEATLLTAMVKRYVPTQYDDISADADLQRTPVSKAAFASWLMAWIKKNWVSSQ